MVLTLYASAGNFATSYTLTFMLYFTLGQQTEFCNADRGGVVKLLSNSAIRRDRNTILVSTLIFSG